MMQVDASLVQIFLWVGIAYFVVEIIDTVRFWFSGQGE